jgi:hypothetical protein
LVVAALIWNEDPSVWALLRAVTALGSFRVSQTVWAALSSQFKSERYRVLGSDLKILKRLMVILPSAATE